MNMMYTLSRKRTCEIHDWRENEMINRTCEIHDHRESEAVKRIIAFNKNNSNAIVINDVTAVLILCYYYYS